MCKDKSETTAGITLALIVSVILAFIPVQLEARNDTDVAVALLWIARSIFWGLSFFVWALTTIAAFVADV